MGNKQGEVISNSEYRSRDGVSSTELKRIAISPLHYKYWKEHPQESDTPALLFGRGAHKYILETDSFFEEFSVMPICDRRTKDGKAIYEKVVEDSKGKDVISHDDFEKIKAMKEAMDKTPFVKRLLDGEHEKSFFWTDKETGIKCKVRPDSFNEQLGVIIDYKTCQSAEPRKFMNKSIDLNYDLQAAFYCDGLKENIGKDFKFVFLAQEKTAPYAVAVYECSEEYIRSGTDMYKSMLRTYKKCTETGNWYSYMGENPEILSLNVPVWLQNLYGESEDFE